MLDIEVIKQNELKPGWFETRILFTGMHICLSVILLYFLCMKYYNGIPFGKKPYIITLMLSILFSLLLSSIAMFTDSNWIVNWDYTDKNATLITMSDSINVFFWGGSKILFYMAFSFYIQYYLYEIKKIKYKSVNIITLILNIISLISLIMYAIFDSKVTNENELSYINKFNIVQVTSATGGDNTNKPLKASMFLFTFIDILFFCFLFTIYFKHKEIYELRKALILLFIGSMSTWIFLLLAIFNSPIHYPFSIIDIGFDDICLFLLCKWNDVLYNQLCCCCIKCCGISSQTAGNIPVNDTDSDTKTKTNLLDTTTTDDNL